MSIILYPEDKIRLREVLIAELRRHRHCTETRFLADDLVKEVETFLEKFEEPWCESLHCPEDCDDDCCDREHKDD